MLDQTFSVNNFLKLISKHEIIRFKLGRNRKEYQAKIKQEINLLTANGVPAPKFNRITLIQSNNIKNKNMFASEDLIMHLMLKKTASNLKRIYKIHTPSRNEISSQVLRIIEMSASYSIIKLDIASFYENTPFNKVLKKLEDDRLLSQENLKFLSGLIDELNSQYNISGLPRGLSISPFLAELYIRTFDEEIKSLPEVYYYSRYVDDIIIITFNDAEQIKKIIINKLHALGFRINNKSQSLKIPIIIDSICNQEINELIYLGYKYKISNFNYNGRRVIKVLLSDKKVKKIKSKILLAFIDYRYNHDLQLLLERIQILANNYPIHKAIANKVIHTGILKTGVFYGNPLVNQPGLFKEFNFFINKLIYTKKNNFIGQTVQLLKNDYPGIQAELKKSQYDFYNGFCKKIFYPFDEKRMKQLKKCWENKF